MESYILLLMKMKSEVLLTRNRNHCFHMGMVHYKAYILYYGNSILADYSAVQSRVSVSILEMKLISSNLHQTALVFRRCNLPQKEVL